MAAARDGEEERDLRRLLRHGRSGQGPATWKEHVRHGARRGGRWTTTSAPPCCCGGSARVSRRMATRRVVGPPRALSGSAGGGVCECECGRCGEWEGQEGDVWLVGPAGDDRRQLPYPARRVVAVVAPLAALSSPPRPRGGGRIALRRTRPPSLRRVPPPPSLSWHPRACGGACVFFGGGSPVAWGVWGAGLPLLHLLLLLLPLAGPPPHTPHSFRGLCTADTRRTTAVWCVCVCSRASAARGIGRRPRGPRASVGEVGGVFALVCRGEGPRLVVLPIIIGGVA